MFEEKDSTHEQQRPNAPGNRFDPVAARDRNPDVGEHADG
jgi:hypothetical protein